MKTDDYIRRPDGSPTNFKYSELTKSDTAIRLGIPNEPGETERRAMERLVLNVLQPVRDRFGPIRVTSGYRSVALCKAVGSSASSNHTRGEAADIEPLTPGVSLMFVLRWIAEHLQFRELIAEYFPDGWIHVAFREGANDGTVKLKDATHNYARVTVDEIEALHGRDAQAAKQGGGRR